MDILIDERRVVSLEQASRAAGMDLWRVSAATGEGTRQLVRELARRLQEIAAEAQVEHRS
jgi:hypothetical protein